MPSHSERVRRSYPEGAPPFGAHPVHLCTAACYVNGRYNGPAADAMFDRALDAAHRFRHSVAASPEPRLLESAMRRSAECWSQNVGHGHVFPRADGYVERCARDGFCRQCAADLALLFAAGGLR